MNNAQVDTAGPHSLNELKEASGIACGDDSGACFKDVIHLSFEELSGHLGLCEIINAGTAAAP